MDHQNLVARFRLTGLQKDSALVSKCAVLPKGKVGRFLPVLNCSTGQQNKKTCCRAEEMDKPNADDQ